MNAHMDTSTHKAKLHRISLGVLSLLVHKMYIEKCSYKYSWPAHPDDPQGIKVASVIEFSVCLSVCLFSVLCSLFS